ncbi:hypothetical protein NC652_031178 [Populus alba x Populus x berolinensis]|nr:hypothetical protein NC652_031178 [Populus alba x Populus x berolinensis]
MYLPTKPNNYHKYTGTQLAYSRTRMANNRQRDVTLIIPSNEGNQHLAVYQHQAMHRLKEGKGKGCPISNLIPFKFLLTDRHQISLES